MNQPLKILIANSGRKWIGEVGHCALLADALTRRGHRVWIACRRDSELERHLQEAKRDFLPLGFSSRFSPSGDLRDILKMADFIRREKVDLVHAHRGKDHWVAAFAAKRASAPLVRTRHVVTSVKQHFRNRWLFGKATSGVISVSKAAEASLGRLIELIPKRRVILSAIDLGRFDPSLRNEVWRREKAGKNFPGEPFWIGLIGRIQRVKGQKEFLAAAKIVAERRPDARFFIAGRGTERKHAGLRKHADALGLGNRVVIEDFLPNLPEVMASLDLGVVASLGSEGFSRVTAELMASGTPLVATCVGAIPEILAPRDGDARPLGKIIPPGDPQAMASAILELMEDESERGRLATAGLRAARENHDPDRWAEKIEEFYREILADRKS